MSSFEKTWETYASSWGAKTAEKKRSLYEQSLAEDCTYTDPLTQRRGFDELLAYMTEFHQMIPGGHFHTLEFIAHNDRSVARWELRDGDENVVDTGISYGEYGPDGKLKTMTGFFVPPGN